jgi:hypothetical protein
MEADDGPGYMCAAGTTVTGTAPGAAAVGVPLDAKVHVFIGSDTPTCPVTSPPETPTVVVTSAGLAIAGALSNDVEGPTAQVIFTPSSPLDPNTDYTIEVGTFRSRFRTGTDGTSPAPTPVSVDQVVAKYSDPTVQTIEVLAAVGDTPIVHLVPSDEHGEPIETEKDWAFVVSGANPLGGHYGTLGIDRVDQVCYVAQTESLAGVRSARSEPRCVSPKSL